MSEQNEPLSKQPVPLRRRKDKSFETMTPEEWKVLQARGRDKQWYLQLEQWVQRLIAAKKENGGSLHGTGLRKQAAEAMGVSVWTIDEKLERYEANPCIDALLERLSGPDSGTTLTSEQQAVIFYVLKNPREEIKCKNGTIRIPTKPGAAFIHREVFPLFFPEVKVSLDQIKHYIRSVRANAEMELVIQLAQRGKRYIEETHMPTPRNDSERPGQRVLIDARPLPIYIQHNGIVCTVSILLMIDDFSRYPIRARLVPRKIIDWNNLPKKADITADDVAVLIASAIWFDNFCFEEVYTDNASSNKTVGDLLAEVAADEFVTDMAGKQDKFIRFVKSIPGRPRGRGKIERALGLLNAAIDGHPGFVVNEQDRKCIANAQKNSKLYTLEQLEVLLNNHLEKLRDQPVGNRKQTRRQLWTSVGKRPALTIRQLVHLMPKQRKAETTVAIDNYKIRFLEEFHQDYFEPRLETETDWWLWVLAIARKERIPLRAIQLDDDQWYVEGCLDPSESQTSWRRLVLKSRQRIDKAWRNEMIAQCIKKIRETGNNFDPQVDNILRELLQSSGSDSEGSLTNEAEPEPADQENALHTKKPVSSPTRRAISSRTRPSTPPPPKPSTDSFDDIDFDALV